MNRVIVEELVKAAKEAIPQWRKQVFLASEFAGEIAVNSGNGPAFIKLKAAIAAAERELNKPIDMGR